jgi:hypothetical protein
MSTFNRDRYRKKLKSLLSKAEDEAFFQMVWALDAIQSNRAKVAQPYFNFPQEAVDPKIDSQYAVHKWDLESLVGRLLLCRLR